MAVEPVRVYEINTGDVANLNNNEICSENTNDADLGFPMWGGKDNSGNVTKWLAKDKNASVNNLTVKTFTTPGFLKNDSSGVITGGNQVSIDDIADKYWLRNNSLGYIYPRTLTDTVGIKTSTPSADLHVHGTFRVQTQAGGNIDEISNDTTFASAADDQLSTALAIKTYVDNSVASSGSKWTRGNSFLGYYTIRPNTTTDRVVIGGSNLDDDTGLLQLHQPGNSSNHGLSFYENTNGMTVQVYISSDDSLYFYMDYSYTGLGITSTGNMFLQNGTAVNNITNDVDMSPINNVTLATTESIDSYVGQAVRWDYSGSNIFPKDRDTTTVSIGPALNTSYSLNVHHNTGNCIHISANTTTPREGSTLAFGGSPSFNYIKELTEDNLVIGFYGTCKLYTTNAGNTCFTAHETGHVSLRLGGEVDEIGVSSSFNWGFADDDQLLSALTIKNYVDSQVSSPWTRTTGTPNYIAPTTIGDTICIGSTSVVDSALNIFDSGGSCLRLMSGSSPNYLGSYIYFGNTSNHISNTSTGRITITASDNLRFTANSIVGLDISNTGYISLNLGTDVNQITTDTTFSSPSDNQLATTLAIKTYVDNNSGSSPWNRITSGTNHLIPNDRNDLIELDDNTSQLNMLTHVLNIGSNEGKCLRLCGASDTSGGRINFGDSNYVYIEEPQGADDTLRIKAPKIHLSRSTGSAIANYTDAILISTASSQTAIGMGYGINDNNYSGAVVYMVKNSSANGNVLKLHNRTTITSPPCYISMYTGTTPAAGVERLKMGYNTSSNVSGAGVEFDGYNFTVYCNENNTRPIKTNAHKVRIGDYDNLPSGTTGPFDLDGFSSRGLMMDDCVAYSSVGSIEYVIECRIGNNGSFVSSGDTFYIPIYGQPA